MEKSLKKVISKKKIISFSIGQLGWALLSQVVTVWIIAFYQPSVNSELYAVTNTVPQGKVVLGALTVIGAIYAIGRVFDAFTDPWIANKSDSSKNPKGRRIPFLKKASVPFAVTGALLFFAPVIGQSGINVAWIFSLSVLFYLFMTMYCTPYNALISELGQTQESRIGISTAISVTFIVAATLAQAVPNIAGFFSSYGVQTSYRIAIALMCAIALICLLVPVFTIKETDYVTPHPVEGNSFENLKKAFSNVEFRKFVVSDVIYFFAIQIFNSGMPFFVSELMGLDLSYSIIFMAIMTILSLSFYPFVGKLAKKYGKKKMVISAFTLYTVALGFAAFMQNGVIYGVILSVLAAIPMAILGILPQAIVADIAESDAITTNENREGMFFAARTFAMKLGQALGALALTTFIASNQGSTGIRLAAGFGAIFCLLSGILLNRYNEKKVYKIIGVKTGNEE